jgi:Cu(I)/Ag(I) efflux system periplasmic protein CusF
MRTMIAYRRKERDMTRKSILIAVLFLGAGLAFHAGADVSRNQLAQNEAKPAEAASAESAEGEVRKVDKAAGKVTIKHGWLRKIDMPPMTMGYRVKDTAMLDHLQPGDKIKFTVERLEGGFTVTSLEKVK